MSDAWKQYKGANGIGGNNTTTGSHGNSLSNPNTNYGYSLVDKDSGEILKFGETIYPNTRYTQEFLDKNNATMKILDCGSKEYIHNWQYDMNSYYKWKYGSYPPLNSKGMVKRRIK